MTRKDKHQTAYAVVRIDYDYPPQNHFLQDLGPSISFDQYDVTVKEVVTSDEEAEREVKRLNQLNANKYCWYFWTGTRYFKDGGSFGTEIV